MVSIANLHSVEPSSLKLGKQVVKNLKSGEEERAHITSSSIFIWLIPNSSSFEAYEYSY
jgi:hypothetical protein